MSSLVTFMTNVFDELRRMIAVALELNVRVRPPNASVRVAVAP